MNFEPKIKKFAFYNVVILLITVQLVIVINYWYFVFKNIGQASINDTISYQGKLVDSTGTAVPDGQYNMEFSIYTVLTGGTPVWTERWSLAADPSTTPVSQNGNAGSQVTVTNGIFSVDLNSLCSDWSDVGTCGTSGGVDFANPSLYLEVKLDALADPNHIMDETFTPRKRFSSIAYSMNSAKLDGKLIGTSGDAIPLLNGDNTFSGTMTTAGVVIMNVAETNLDGLKIVSSQTIDTSNMPTSLFSKKVASWYSGATLLGAIYPFGTMQIVPTTGFPGYVVGAFPNPDPTAIINGLLSTGKLAINADGHAILLFNPAGGNYGTVGINVDPIDTLDVNVTDPTLKGVKVKAAAGQTGDLLDLQDSSGVSILKVAANGLLTSAVPEGTSPMSITSTTLITNLNADLIDGLDSLAFVAKSGDTMTGNLTVGTVASENAVTLFKDTTGNDVGLVATGIDTNVGLDLISKGSGSANIKNTSADYLSLSAGTISVTPATNYALQSQTLDDATAWSSLSGINVIANQTTAPDGTSTADFIKEDTGGIHYIQQFFTFDGQEKVFSAYFKANGRSWVAMAFNGWGGAGSYFNISSGTVGSNFGGTPNAQIVSVGNGWYRCSIHQTATGGTSAGFVVYMADGDGGTSYSYTGDNTSGVYMWGVQMETAASMGTYVATTTAPASVSSSVGAGPNITATGSSTDVNLDLFSKGIGAVNINAPSINLGTGTGTINYLTVTNGTTGVSPVFSADGQTNVNLTIKPKGTGSVTIPSQNLAAIPLIIKGATGQTANLQEWQNANGDILLSVGANGLIKLPVATFANCGKVYTDADGMLACGSDAVGGGFSGGTLSSLLTPYTQLLTDGSDGAVSVALSGNAVVINSTSSADSDVTTAYNITSTCDTTHAATPFTVHVLSAKGVTTAPQTHVVTLTINSSSTGISVSSGTGTGALSSTAEGYEFQCNPFTGLFIKTTIY